MGSHHGESPSNRGPLLWTVALIGGGAALAAIAVGSVVVHVGKSGDAPLTAEQSAQQRCEADVMKRLVSPDMAEISDVRVETSTLDTDGRDFSSLKASEPLKNVDRARITVINVAGVANAPSEVGTTIEDHFDCRAYFVDGTLAHTLVVFDHGH